MSKRGNNIYKRKDGRWEGRYYYKGTRKYKSVYGKTCTEAREKLELLRSETLKPSRKCYYSFFDIMNMWLESKKLNIKESSFASYRAKLKKHIIPYFKGMKYSSINADTLERFVTDKIRGGLSASYVCDMAVMIKSAAKWAEKTYQYINQTTAASLPKRSRKEAMALCSADQKKLIRLLKKENDLTSAGVFLSLFTGIRIGELCALKWSDIDLNNNVLHIKRTLQRISTAYGKNKTDIIISSPKTSASLRDIPLPEFIADRLAKFKGDENAYLLSGTSKPSEPRCFTNRYKRLLKKANLPSYNFHALRHTFATNCLEQNCDIKTLSELLGHSDANITMRIYIHSSMARKAACMERLKLLSC